MALYDAAATMDTVTLIRSAIRGLLRVCDAGLERELRGLLGRDDDYRSAGKPVCEYDYCEACEALVDDWPRTRGRCSGHWTAALADGGRAGRGRVGGGRRAESR